MANIIDLRDLKGNELRIWKQTIEDQTGYNFEELAENEPIMINDSYFEDYARELAEDIGAINKSYGWPNYCIDWARAARELKIDYTSVDVNGETYWFRTY
jgi:hypothetical protein